MIFIVVLNVLLTLFPRFTIQICHDEIYQKKDCIFDNHYPRYRPPPICLSYKMSCYMVSNDLASAHASDVNKIQISLSNVGYLHSKLFEGFNNVDSISMVGVNITMINPYSFNKLYALKNLYLSNNSIEVIHNSSLASPTLQLVDLSHNAIVSIEPNSFNHLNTLIVTYNRIGNVSNLTANCYNLEKLDLSYNFIQVMELTSGCLSLLNLNVSHNKITTFTVTSKVPLKLRSLYLSSNKLHNITSKSFQNLNELSTLDLSGNPVFQKSDPPTDLFQSTIELKHLNLSSTGMQKISIGILTKLFMLQELDLSNNELSYLPKGIFHDTMSLKILYINNNRLSLFRYDELKNLAQINLNGNVWMCDTLSDLINDLLNKNVHVIHGDARDVENILGISCIDTIENTRITKKQFQPLVNSTDDEKEYLSLLHNLNLGIQQIIQQQEDRSQIIISQYNTSHVYWSKIINQDYKKFFQTVEHSVQELIDKITSILNLTQNASSSKVYDASSQWGNFVTNFTESFRNDRKGFIYEIKTVLESTLSRIGKEFQEAVNADRKGVTEEMRNIFNACVTKIQANFQETVDKDRKNFIDEVRNVLSPIVSTIENNFSVIIRFIMNNGSVSRPISNDSDLVLPKSLSFKRGNDIYYSNQNYQILAIGVYGIFLVLVVGLIFYLVTKAKSYRTYKPQSSDCNFLHSMPI